MPKKPHESEFFIELEPGKAIRIRATVFEEGMPTPGEADVKRAPSNDESAALAHVMRAPTGEEAIRLAIQSQRLGPISIQSPF